MERVLYEVFLPLTMAKHFAKWTFENGVLVQLSFTEDKFFDGVKIRAFVIVPKEVEAGFSTEFNNHIIKK